MSAWDTHDELAFIDGLANHRDPGEHKLKPSPTDADRLHLLLLYQQGIKMRTRWDTLDQKKIENHLQSLINNLQQSVNKEKK